MSVIVLYLALGVCAGFLGGLLGLGGGIVVVPALYFLYVWQQFPPEVTMHLAVGTSLATAVFTAGTSTLAHHRHGAVQWAAFRSLAPGVLLGGLLGGLIADSMPTATLRTVFGLFEIFVAAQMAAGLKPRPQRRLPGTTAMWTTGAGIGTASAVLGIGGGTLTVPFLLWCNVGIREAVATSAAVGLPITLAGSIGHLYAGWGEAKLPDLSSGYVYWPATLMVAAASVFFAPLGARVAHRLPVPILKRIFAVVVAMIGMRMLAG
jgi:uncharacterized membrane protein YfcA